MDGTPLPSRTPVRSLGPLARVGVLAALLLAGGCGDTNGNGEPPGAGTSESALSQFELEHGIGPVTSEVTLGPLDEEKAARGEQVFQFNCEACHFLDDRFVGPPLGDVLERRSPTFVMNMILNPEQMVRDHPEGQAMLAEYPLIMPYQNISEDEARAIVEYLRTVKEQQP